MSPPPSFDRGSVTLSRLFTPRSIARLAVAPPEPGRDAAAAAVLAMQVRSRIGAALCVAVVQLEIVYWFGGTAQPGMLLGLTLIYSAFSGAYAIALGRLGRATPALVSLTLAGDLAFIFAMTIAGTTPTHYERALFGSMIVVHLANFYFGRRQAWRMVVLALGAYLGLMAWTGDRVTPMDRVEDLWSLTIGVLGTALVIVNAGDVRRRLRALVTLFERAEEGDFSGEYDEAADRRPDAITRVGRAYNRVRMHLASMVLTDPLTGCLNRRGFDQALAREVARSSRAGSELALLALDLDHFKSINDTHGHLVGDEVLRAAGALLLQACRSGDIVARTGGEEFALLLPDTDAAGAFQFASRVCDIVRGHPFPPPAAGAEPIRITTSIGVVAGAPEVRGDFAALFSARADVALYVAKRSGRDRARVWSSELAAGDSD
jgi:diguanylate cyclase (GGDEF)-like protein